MSNVNVVAYSKWFSLSFENVSLFLKNSIEKKKALAWVWVYLIR